MIKDVIIRKCNVNAVVNHPTNRSKNAERRYDVKLCFPSEVTAEELARCMALIGAGGAVSIRTMKRDLPRSQVLAIARYGGEIVAVGSIKPVRQEYAARIAAKCKYDFPAETPELGYVAVDTAHQGRGLSHELTDLLLSGYEGRLFATTDSPRMKKSLADSGFVQQGKEWEGDRGILSFWERKE